jgi:hypothetical protein
MNKNRLNRVEQKLGVNDKEMIVCFSGKDGCVVSSKGKKKSGEIFKSFDEIKELYKNHKSILLNVSGFGGINGDWGLSPTT